MSIFRRTRNAPTTTPNPITTAADHLSGIDTSDPDFTVSFDLDAMREHGFTNVDEWRLWTLLENRRNRPSWSTAERRFTTLHAEPRAAVLNEVQQRVHDLTEAAAAKHEEQTALSAGFEHFEDFRLWTSLEILREATLKARS